MNKTIKHIGITGLAALLIMGAGAAAFAREADKAGYINIQRVVSESTMGKKKAEEHAVIREQKDKILREKLTEIEALNNELKKEREKKTLDRKKIAETMEKIQQKNKEAERYVADAKEELAKKDLEFVREILVKAAPILRDIGDNGGYAVILKNIEDIVYVGPGADITDEVIKRLNSIK